MRGRAALALLLAGCGGAAAVGPRVERVWPDPPAPARVRWLGSFPEAGPAPRPPWWERAASAVAGVDSAAPARPVLARPFGVAAAGGGFLVADPDGRRVLRVTWPGGEARELTCAGREYRAPIAVAAAGSDVYVADGAILKIGAAGRCVVIGGGLLERPSGVAVAGDRLYTVDPPRHAVDVFALDGRHLLGFGARGDAAGPGLNYPTGIAIAPDGTLLVVDALNFRVARFDREGRFLGAVGRAGDGGGAFGRPKAIAVDATGRLLVSDALHDVVVVLAPSGAFELAFGGSGAGPGDLALPAGVAVSGRVLYVADSHNRRVGVYRLEDVP